MYSVGKHKQERVKATGVAILTETMALDDGELRRSQALKCIPILPKVLCSKRRWVCVKRAAILVLCFTF